MFSATSVGRKDGSYAITPDSRGTAIFSCDIPVCITAIFVHCASVYYRPSNQFGSRLRASQIEAGRALIRG